MNQPKNYDVIIVGAGPAGLNCAKVLGNAGKKVLLVEKNAEIGPKVCAGGLTSKDLEYLKIPKKLLEFEFSEAIFSTPLSKIKIKNDGVFAYTINRKEFGQWQLSQLHKDNVKILTSTKVTKIEKNQVTTNRDEKFSFSYLIGADGAFSVVRKHLNLSSKNTLIALQYMVPTDKYSQFELYYNSKFFSSGYAWIFPHRGFASIGCGTLPKYSKGLKERFLSWAKSHKINLLDGKYEAFAINYDYKGCEFGNIFLIGDAAGLASSFTGEGIYQALISGEEIAQKILDPSYRTLKLAEILRFNKRHLKALNIVENSSLFRPLFLELIAFSLKSKSFQKFALSKLL